MTPTNHLTQPLDTGPQVSRVGLPPSAHRIKLSTHGGGGGGDHCYRRFRYSEGGEQLEAKPYRRREGTNLKAAGTSPKGAGSCRALRDVEPRMKKGRSGSPSTGTFTGLRFGEQRLDIQVSVCPVGTEPPREGGGEGLSSWSQ